MQTLNPGYPIAIKARPRRARRSQVGVSLRTLGHTKLAGLCDAVGMNADLETCTTLFDLLSESWAARTHVDAHLLSDITDDSSPFEFSLAFEDGQPEVRMLAEAQGDGTAMSNWAAAWQLTEQLGRFYDVSLARAHKIADLFEPTAAVSSFSLWHAACIRPGRAPALKLYFNPLARGEALGEETMREAFARLGQSDSFEWLQEHALLRGHKDRFVYFSLDLGDHGEVRTKVYIAHYNATPSEVERVMAAAPSHVAGDATAFCDAMVGGSYETFDLRPLLTCFAFVSGRREPTTVTLHIPIRCYAQNDQDVLERVGDFLSLSEASLHAQAVRSIASRPLDARSGIQTYTSFRRVDGRKRLTIYLSPELYSGHGH